MFWLIGEVEGGSGIAGYSICNVFGQVHTGAGVCCVWPAAISLSHLFLLFLFTVPLHYKVKKLKKIGFKNICGYIQTSEKSMGKGDC